MKRKERTIKRTGLIFDHRFLAHDTGDENTVILRDRTFELSPQPHPSSLVITQRIKEFLDYSGLSEQMLEIPTRPALEQELLSYHTGEYLVGVRAYANGGPASGSWGYADSETILRPESYDAALYAVGGILNGVSALWTEEIHNIYALVRPAGHHATRNQALGFCVFNDVVLAANYARNVHGLERILILDWDVHHGNGIQDAFYNDAEILFISLHQQNWFPELAGELDQVGAGPGVGYTVNIPLPPGTGDRGYQSAFEQLVLPIARQFVPQLILVVAGHDASWLDPLAQMMMSMDGFRQMTERVVELAEETCDGRLMLVQAGGYSASYVPYCAAASVEALTGKDLGIVDLYHDAPELKRCQTIFSQDTQRAIDAAVTCYRQWWEV